MLLEKCIAASAFKILGELYTMLRQNLRQTVQMFTFAIINYKRIMLETLPNVYKKTSANLAQSYSYQNAGIFMHIFDTYVNRLDRAG